MFKLVLSFTILLSLVGMNNGQNFRTCDYVKNVKTGEPTFIFNDNYPNNYPRGRSCQWVVEADQPITLSCSPFEIPFSTGCTLSTLTIQDGTKKEDHCGKGDVYFVSKSTKIILTLVAAVNTVPGKFFCTAETVLTPNNDTGCGCGKRNNLRIVGGKETEINEYPMMSALIDLDLKFLLCGATIINERQLITAAHCLDKRPTHEIGVRIGAHDLSQDTEENNENFFHVESCTLHPQYNHISQDYDIAVVTIVGMMTFSRKVSPVCLPFQRQLNTFDGVSVDILGWGSTEFAGGPSRCLQKAQLSVVPNGICSQTYRDLTTRQLCTQSHDKDSCQFDSGGPVLWQNPTTRRLVGIGIISLGSVCADGDPAVNTRVGAFIDWIMKQTPPGISYCAME